MVLFDVLGKRWTLRILWELRDGPLPFRALRERCDLMSPTSLNQRLKEFRELQLVELREEGYAMTQQGISLGKQLARLDIWAKQWAEYLGSKATKRDA